MNMRTRAQLPDRSDRNTADRAAWRGVAAMLAAWMVLLVLLYSR